MIVAALATIALNYWVSSVNADHSRRYAIIDNRVADLSVPAAEFENRVSAFISSGAQPGIFDDKQRDDLLDNVQKQISALNRIMPFLSDAQRPIADKYAYSLIKIRDILQDKKVVESARTFGEAAIAVTQLRQKLIRSLV